MTSSSAQTQDPTAYHGERRDSFAKEVSALEQRDRIFSMARLLLFAVGAIALTAGIYDQRASLSALGTSAFFGFAIAVALHLRLLKHLEQARIRRDIHVRHLQRIDGGFRTFEHDARAFASDHAYAHDLDLCGPGSLLQRIDVTHTERGARMLALRLSQLDSLEEIRARQLAVRELAGMHEFRQELEARALEAAHEKRLDGSAFSAFAKLPSLFAQFRGLAYFIFLLPPATALLFALGQFGLLHKSVWLLPMSAQGFLVLTTQNAVRRAFDLGSARQGVVEAFENMLVLAEATRFESDLLRAIHQRLRIDDTPPSTHMSRLRRWVSLGELRQQFLLWAALNPLLLWDLHILRGMERWNAQVGSRSEDWFVALGELESLSSLATLHALEPNSTFPEITDAEAPLKLQGLFHPLISANTRVANDIALRGPGTAVIVTGSNMAGKSTLLRAVGLNVALALAGGPVCATRARIPRLRLRASMRAQDNLQEGASYFHAELQKLHSVVENADDSPPILFLLDELLRGTNERARHIGAKAVLMHLLQRRACGFVATHDVALAALADTMPDRIENVHFTDVMEGDEMRFDYKLRKGVVKTSNALRLLAMAGIDVPEDAAQTMSSTPIAQS